MANILRTTCGDYHLRFSIPVLLLNYAYRAVREKSLNTSTPSSAALFYLLQNFNLTPSQSDAVIQIGNLIDHDEENVFLLKGHAGTGKTLFTP